MPGPNCRHIFQLIIQYHLDATSVNHEWYQWLRFQIENGLMAEDVAQGLLPMVEADAQTARDHPQPLHRPASVEELHADGPPDIELGHLVHAPDVRFGLRLFDRARSVLVAGNQGSGKTTAIQKIARQVYAICQNDPKNQISLIVLDRKLDYVHLPGELGADWVHVSVHDGSVRIGLNAPAGVPPQAWINLIATSFCARAGLVSAWTALANMIRWLLGVLNPAPTQTLVWPSLKLLLEVATSCPLTLWASKPEYARSLLGALDAATQSTELFDCFGGLDIDALVRQGKHLLLEMPNMSPAWLRQYMIDLLINHPLVGRIHRRDKVDRTVGAVIIDEADPDATAESDRRFPDGMSPLATALRMGREVGLAFVIGLAKLQGASPFVLGEPLYHVILNQSDAASIALAASTLLLPRGAEVMLPALRPGQCIFRESQGPWPHPMLGQIDYVAPGRGPVLRPRDELPFIPAKTLRDLPHVQEALQELIHGHRASHMRQVKSHRKEPSLSKHAETLLHAAALYPYYPVARLYEKASLSLPPQTQINIRKELELAKLAEFQELRVSSANILLIRRSDANQKHQGRGSIAHQHVAHWLREVGTRRGFTSHIEWLVPGTNHPVDVVWLTPDGKTQVFEVVIECEDNLPAHIESCFVDSQAIDNLTIVVTQKSIRARLQKELLGQFADAPFRDRIQFEIVENIMKEMFES